MTWRPLPEQAKDKVRWFREIKAIDAEITGKLVAGSITGGDITSDSWNGAEPLDLTSEDTTATAGYAFDSSAGAGQLEGDLFVGGDISLSAGSILRTAASGNRIELSGTDNDRMNVYTGAAAETAAGYIQVADNSTQFRLEMVAPSNSVGNGSTRLWLSDENTAGAVGPQARFQYDGASSTDPILIFENEFQVGLSGEVGMDETRPAMAFANDTDSGIWRNASDDWSAGAGGEELLRIRDDAADSGEGGVVIYEHDGTTKIFPGVHQTFTPTIKAVTTDPTLGTGNTAKGVWYRVGQVVHVHILWKFGTSGTAAGSGDYYWEQSVDSLPTVEASDMFDSGSNTNWVHGEWAANDGTTRWCGSVLKRNSNLDQFVMVRDAAGLVTHAAPTAWGASDSISMHIVYPTTDK